jgi:hypothetical protein
VSRAELEEAFRDLRADLIREGGPQISTMRNYRYAILQYEPKFEFDMRDQVQRLVSELADAGWVVRTLSLQTLMVERIRALGDEAVQRMVQLERSTAKMSPERGLNFTKERLTRLLEGPDGIAADVVREICAFADKNPDKAERTLVLLGRAGALYPFTRLSSLLKHIDGHTRHIPVVLLYPGYRRGDAGLSFMGELDPDRDYRPRVYPSRHAL